MYLWVPIIACPKLTLLYINYTTNIFVPVLRKRILDIMLPVSRIIQSILLSEMLRLFNFFRSYILALRLFFSRVSCIFSSLHPRFASLFQSSILSIFQSYILTQLVVFFLAYIFASQGVYFIQVKLNRTQSPSGD